MALSKKQNLLEAEENLEKGLGEMLRYARESQGLDYFQLAEMTKLRPHVLESLENEEWQTFSAPVFIKGFLRSYAGALNLDAEAVIRMYEEKNPGKDSVPRPLASLVPPRKRSPAFFIILVLLAGCAVFALHYYTSHRQAGTQSKPPEQLSDTPASAPEENGGHAKEAGMGNKGAKEAEGALEPVVETQKGKKEADIQKEQMPPETVQQEEAVSETDTPQTVPEEAVTNLSEEAKPGETEGSSPPVPEYLTLKAQVTEKTWVKIILDQEAPREYIFQPGSHPEWKARHAFELFIGNAAGIALEFKGRKLENLGGHGKVVHLRLPEESERNARE
jgi:cytoskeleton protein RodZ